MRARPITAAVPPSLDPCTDKCMEVHKAGEAETPKSREQSAKIERGESKNFGPRGQKYRARERDLKAKSAPKTAKMTL